MLQDIPILSFLNQFTSKLKIVDQDNVLSPDGKNVKWTSEIEVDLKDEVSKRASLLPETMLVNNNNLWSMI